MANDFVESTVPLRSVKSAVEKQHTHDNKALLDSLISDGQSVQYLGADGQYHDFPSMFFVDAFLEQYDQAAGNVGAFANEQGKLYLQAINTFAKALGDKVIGSIEVEQAESNPKQLNVSIAEVDVNSGDITENAIKYLLVGSGLSVGFVDGVISFALDTTDELFTNYMVKQTDVVEGVVAVFGTDGSVVGGGKKLSDLVTSTTLQNHIDNMELHVTKALQESWSAKQNALSEVQLTAVNSGITAVKVSQYDAYVTNKVESITHANLLAKLNSSQLIAGQLYRITDYVTTTVQAETQSAGHGFDIIVAALSENKLDENAFATQRAGDSYFANSKLEAWRLKYCLTNDTTRFAWASSSGKGVIYEMIDEFNNKCGYDFKNIQFKRYKITEFQKCPDLVNDYCGARQVGGDSLYPSGATISQTDTVWRFTFDGNGTDISLRGRGSSTSDGYGCYGNEIFPYFRLTGAYKLTQFLNNVVFLNNATSSYSCCHNRLTGNIIFTCTFGRDCYSNTFGNNCHSNTFGNYCTFNTFGNNCHSNTFGDSCTYNAFGDSCHSNTFGNNCRYNTFGNYCYSNAFGNKCRSNAFGNECDSNTFGNECNSNTFGNNYRSNTFGYNCNYNTFGDSCTSNTFGDSCGYNAFGNNCYSNTFGNYCYSNAFGNYCTFNTFGNYSQYNLMDGDNQYILLSYESANSSNRVVHYHFTLGFKGSSSSNRISCYIAVNLEYEYIFYKTASTTWCCRFYTGSSTLLINILYKTSVTATSWSTGTTE